MRKKIPNIIAIRKLHQIDPDGKTVFVQIGKPRKVSKAEWECAFHITNIGMHEIQFGHGIDGLQALIQAIEGCRVFLDRSKIRFKWEGGGEGEICIHRYVLPIFGKKFTRHLHKLIDSETERFSYLAEKRYATKAKHKKLLKRKIGHKKEINKD